MARDGALDWVALGFGSAKGKVRMETLLAGPGADAKVTGAYAPHARQHVDFDTTQEHGAPNTTSDLAFRGILADRSSAVWRGMIKVDPGAQQTDAFQVCRNLLLSKKAHADAIPGLEILANDVRCTHAAAVAQIDKEQLFYLRSRGLDQASSTRLVIEGFMAELVERFEEGPMREALGTALEQRLAHAPGLMFEAAGAPPAAVFRRSLRAISGVRRGAREKIAKGSGAGADMAGMVRSAIRPLLALALMLALLGAEAAQRGARRGCSSSSAPSRARRAPPSGSSSASAATSAQRLAIVHGFTARVPAARDPPPAPRRPRSAASAATSALTLSSTTGRPGRGPSRRPRSTRRPPRSPPTCRPTRSPREVIGDAAEDAAAGSSLAPDPVASGEDTVPAVQDAVDRPRRAGRARRRRRPGARPRLDRPDPRLRRRRPAASPAPASTSR